MKVVAFLQNMWVRDPARVHAGIARYGESYRRRCTYQFLFAGCLTGRRIRRELGNLCESIVWEEASREILDNPRTVPKPDVAHVWAVIESERPASVICFGQVANEAVYGTKIVTVRSPHPAARSVDCQSRFKVAMAEVRRRFEALDA